MARKKTVLIADDDPLFRGMVQQVVENAGYTAIVAEDGQDGWEKLQSKPVDMAVLDLNMPRLDGLGLTKKIRGDARFANMPVLLLTIKSLVEDQVSGFDRGADDYLTKPFDPKMLTARLKVLERRILNAPTPPKN